MADRSASTVSPARSGSRTNRGRNLARGSRAPYRPRRGWASDCSRTSSSGTSRSSGRPPPDLGLRRSGHGTPAARCSSVMNRSSSAIMAAYASSLPGACGGSTSGGTTRGLSSPGAGTGATSEDEFDSGSVAAAVGSGVAPGASSAVDSIAGEQPPANMSKAAITGQYRECIETVSQTWGLGFTASGSGSSMSGTSSSLSWGSIS